MSDKKINAILEKAVDDLNKNALKRDIEKLENDAFLLKHMNTKGKIRIVGGSK